MTGVLLLLFCFWFASIYEYMQYMQYNIGGEEKPEKAVDEGYKCQLKGQGDRSVKGAGTGRQLRQARKGSRAP